MFKSRKWRFIIAAISACIATLGLSIGAGIVPAHAVQVQHIITSYYGDATDPTTDSTQWGDIEAEGIGNGGPVTDAIVNMCAADGTGSGGCNGTTSSPQMDEDNDNWDGTIAALVDSGITPLYYITTNYDPGTDPWTLADVEAEMADAVSWYGTGIGFMFDETSTSTSSSVYTNYYNALYTYATGPLGSGDLGLTTPVMFNPGTPETTNDYMFDGTSGTQEILQQFEGNESSLNSLSLSGLSWMTSYPNDDFSATVYGESNGVQAAADESRVAEDGIGNVYVTDSGSGGNTYADLPSFWTTEWELGNSPDGPGETQLDPGTEGSPDQFGYYQTGGWCLQEDSVAANANLEMEHCDASTTQDMYEHADGTVSSGPYAGYTKFQLAFYNAGTTLCMDMPTASNGSLVELESCSAANAEQWVWIGNSNGDLAWINPYDTDSHGHYEALDERGGLGSLTTGTEIDVYNPNISGGNDTYDNQDWDQPWSGVS